MKRWVFLVGLSALLAGCISTSDREMPGLQTKFVALDAAQSLVTPELTKECSDRIVKELPHYTVVGSFFLSAKAARMVGREDVSEFFGKPSENDDIVALIAPSTNAGLFGQENKAFVGCSYNLQNNRLVFRKVHASNFLPRRIN
jgi:hypothetical protein